jgi:hypothetical protein
MVTRPPTLSLRKIIIMRSFQFPLWTITLILVGSLTYKIGNSQVFAPNVQVDDGLPFTQYPPSIARGLNDELYVMFEDTREGGDMYFAKSLDRGKTWSRPNIRVSDTCLCDLGLHSCLTVDDVGTIYGAWTDRRRDDGGEDEYDIYFSSSTNGGETWSQNVRVNDSSRKDKVITSMTVAPDQSVCVVWTDWRHGTSDEDVYFARSTDGGQTWTDPNIRVDDGRDGDQRDADICADQWGNLYVGYAYASDYGRFHVYLVRSTDYGETWSSPAKQIDDGRVADNDDISLKVAPSGLYAAWRMYGGGMDNIVFSKSTDGGETWSRPVIRVDHIGPGLWSEKPDLAIGKDGTLYVTWARWDVYEDPFPDVFFGMSTDEGQTWTNPSIRVNDVQFQTQYFSKLVLGSDQTAYLVWQDSRGGEDKSINGIYFTRTVPVLAYGEADSDTVVAGGNFGVRITLVNTTGAGQTADIWTGMMLLTGGMYRKGTMMYGPEAFSLTPYDTLFEHIVHEIPGDTPVGEYEYWVKVDEDRPIYDPPHRLDTDEDRYYLFKDSFTFTVVEGVVRGHKKW